MMYVLARAMHGQNAQTLLLRNPVESSSSPLVVRSVVVRWLAARVGPSSAKYLHCFLAVSATEQEGLSQPPTWFMSACQLSRLKSRSLALFLLYG